MVLVLLYVLLSTTMDSASVVEPLPPGLVAGYAFDEGSGSTTADVTTNNLTGTLSGAAWTSAGKFGRALTFDGVNDWVTVADTNALDVTTGMTLEAWVFPTASGAGSWQNVLMKERAGGETYNLYANADINAPVVYVVPASQPAMPPNAAGASQLPLNAWSHLAATYDNTTLRLYVNGVQVGSRAVSGALMTSTGALRIGGNNIWGEFFAGRIDEVRIYNRALSATEIQADMSTPLGEPVEDTSPPVRSNGQPSGTLPAGTTQTTLSLSSDEAATCRYSMTPGVAYGAMTSTFATTGDTSHATTVSGLFGGGTYSYFVRCQDAATNVNANDFTISFSVASGPTPPTVAVTWPLDTALVAGIVDITASASDAVGVLGVQFLLNDANLGAEDTSAPYTFTWDTTSHPAGAYTLSARARNGAGLSTTSVPITITVANNPVPANFTDEIVIGAGVTFPTAMEFLPDGRMLIAEFTGRLLAVQPGATTVDATPVLQLTNIFTEDVTLGGERGLVNVVADPAFSTNGYIYLFYTAATPQRDRVSRFTMTGNTASLDSELVVWQGQADSASTDHHGGGLAFGPDGKLYISTGDNGDPASSQPLSGDHGKILRVNKNGTVPTDNPFFDGAGPNVDAIWARGLRNPYRFSFDVPTGRMYIGEVGQNTTEEINIGAAGANYGCPICEGPCGTAGMTNPLFTYPHAGRDAAVTGGFVYRGTQFPASYQGAYFYGDFAQNTIRYLTFDGAGTVTGSANFLPADGTLDGPYDPVMLKPGPDGSLYYVDFGWGWQAEQNPATIRRIRYSPGNQPPVPIASALPLSGVAPLSVSFSASSSIDPEGQPLSYSWTFGDGGTSTQANPVHIYTQPGVYQARVSVSDGPNSSLSQILTISVGTVPQGTITSPVNGGTFVAGSVISFAGTGTDAEDGPLPPSAFTWTVLFRHDSHAHPALGPTSGLTSGSFSIPTTGHDFTGNTRYEIILTVTDSDGLQHTSSVLVFPQKVNLTFVTSPAGLAVTIDGISQTTPYVKDTLRGFQHTINAPDQSAGAVSYTFSAWSDGGAQSHGIVVPATSQSYTATFQTVGPPPLPPGLVAGYAFDEGSGTTTADVTTNNLQGSLSGATWTSAGKFGQALSFDGVNDWVTVADANALDLTTGMTLEAWLFPTASGGGSWRNVVMKERSGGEIYNLYANNNVDAPVVYVVRASQPGVPLDAAGTSQLPINTWSHVAVTYNNTTLRLYVNGVQVGSRAVTGALLASTGALRIGGNSIWGEFFAGRIDEVRIYNRALSATEIQTDMNTPLGGPAPDTTPPVRSNGQPTGTLPAGTTQTTLSLTTNEAATCRYSSTAGVAYSAMTLTFATTGGTTHATPITGLTNGGAYAYFARCQDANGNVSPDDFPISFSVAQPPPPDTTPPVRSNGLPTGALPAGTAQTTLSLTTNENATCRYSTTAGVSYGSMPSVFSTTGGTAHSTTVTGLTNGTSYSFFVRCLDGAGNASSNDFVIGFSVAQTPPAPTGLVAAYGFNAGTGTTAADASGGSHTGTITGATWITTGRYGNALSFDGVNDWVTVADANALDLTTGMTLEVWVYPTVGGATWRNVLIKERPGGEVYNLYGRTDTGVPAAYAIRSAAPNTPLDALGTTALPLDAWSHLAATYDGSTLRLFVNGTQVGSRTMSGTLLTSTGVLRIGGNGIWGEFFAGRIDEVRVYNRALTQAEIQADMNNPVQ